MSIDTGLDLPLRSPLCRPEDEEVIILFLPDRLSGRPTSVGEPVLSVADMACFARYTTFRSDTRLSAIMPDRTTISTEVLVLDIGRAATGGGPKLNPLIVGDGSGDNSSCVGDVGRLLSTTFRSNTPLSAIMPDRTISTEVLEVLDDGRAATGGGPELKPLIVGDGSGDSSSRVGDAKRLLR